jgi:hypothetical protein
MKGMFGSGSKHQRDSDSADVREASEARIRDIVLDLHKEQIKEAQKQHEALLAAIATQNDAFKTEMASMLNNLQAGFQAKLDAQEKAFTECIQERDRQILDLTNQLNSLQQKCAGATEEVEARAARRSNIVVHGIQESIAAHALKSFFSKQCAEALGDCFSPRDIIDVYRLGRRPAAAASAPSKPRPVLVKFSSVAVRDAAMRSKRGFKTEEGKLFLDPDLTPAEQKQKRALGPTFRALRQHKMRPFWRNAVLFFYPDPAGQRFEQHPANNDPSKRLSPEDVPLDSAMGEGQRRSGRA